MILQTSKKYKTIKHIVLHWGERELLRYPYPIILKPLLKGFWPEDYVSEISHPYVGTSFSMYFAVKYEAPMHLKTKFSKREDIITSEIEEEVDYDRPPQPLKDYALYCRSFLVGLGLSSYSSLAYDIYSEMFEQSQIIVKNMDLDNQDLFKGVEDIRLDVSKSSYREDFLEGQNLELSLANLGYVCSKASSVERYYQAQTYRYGLEESKGLLLTYLGEQNSEGYSGVNENFFKNYTHRIQLVSLLKIHHKYVVVFSSGERRENLERANLWIERIFVGHTYRDFKFLRNLSNAEYFYLRRFYKKFRLLNR